MAQNGSTVPSARQPLSLLLAEDDDTVRAFLKHILENNGYRVTEACDGKEALSIVVRNSPPIDVVLTDMMMPELTGWELAQRLRELRPNLPVLFMTGYAESAILRAEVPEDTDLLLQKPFRPEELLKRLQQVLEGNFPG